MTGICLSRANCIFKGGPYGTTSLLSVLPSQAPLPISRTFATWSWQPCSRSQSRCTKGKSYFFPCWSIPSLFLKVTVLCYGDGLPGRDSESPNKCAKLVLWIVAIDFCKPLPNRIWFCEGRPGTDSVAYYIWVNVHDDFVKKRMQLQ